MFFSRKPTKEKVIKALTSSGVFDGQGKTFCSSIFKNIFQDKKLNKPGTKSQWTLTNFTTKSLNLKHIDNENSIHFENINCDTLNLSYSTFKNIIISKNCTIGSITMTGATIKSLLSLENVTISGKAENQHSLFFVGGKCNNMQIFDSKIHNHLNLSSTTFNQINLTRNNFQHGIIISKSIIKNSFNILACQMGDKTAILKPDRFFYTFCLDSSNIFGDFTFISNKIRGRFIARDANFSKNFIWRKNRREKFLTITLNNTSINCLGDDPEFKPLRGSFNAKNLKIEAFHDTAYIGLPERLKWIQAFDANDISSIFIRSKIKICKQHKLEISYRDLIASLKTLNLLEMDQCIDIIENKDEDEISEILFFLEEVFSANNANPIYKTLANTYKNCGHKEEAKKLNIKYRKNETLKAYSSSIEDYQFILLFYTALKDLFWGKLTNYGYSPFKALWHFLVLFTFNYFLISYAADANPSLLAPLPMPGSLANSLVGDADNYPSFSKTLFTIDTLLPLLDLKQDSYWTIKNRLIVFINSASHILSWILLSILLAGISKEVDKK